MEFQSAVQHKGHSYIFEGYSCLLVRNLAETQLQSDSQIQLDIRDL